MVISLQQNIKSQSKILKSKLFLVDLAGSESLDKTGATGERLDEAKTINLGLLALGKVINGLTEGQAFVNYRESKLTRILKESLGGNSKTTLIITASPSIYNETETISTMRFGTRAKMIKNKPVINMELSKEQLIKMIEQKTLRVEFLEGYSTFLENHIVGVLKQPLPAYADKDKKHLDDTCPLGSTLTSNNTIQQGDDLRAESDETARLVVELKEKMGVMEDQIRSFEESDKSQKSKVDELSNKNNKLEIEIKNLNERLNISNSKMITLVQTLKMMEDEFKIVEEHNIELENQNNELVNMVEDLEEKLSKQVATPFKMEDLLGMSESKNVTSALESSLKEGEQGGNTSIPTAELNKIVDLLKAKNADNESLKQKNGEMQLALREVMNSYKTLVEKEIPDLENEHRAVTTNLKKVEAKNDFVFNDKIMAIVYDYLSKNSILESELNSKKNIVTSLQTEIAELRKLFNEKIGASQKKMKVLVNCVDSLAKHTEEIMINNLSNTKSKLEVNLNQNDLFNSMINPANLQKSMFEGNKSNIIKVLKGGK